MVSGEDNIVQFLLGLGVLEEKDALTIREAQAGPIIDVLVRRQALSPDLVVEAEELLKNIISSSNHMRRMKYQMQLMRLITSKMHERMEVSRLSIREHREKVTSGNYPVVTAAMIKVK